ncbi:ciliogenesis-associated TTC17-interacting protein isoform X2 [Oenanthe melanoleuca]|uniref:ciliogenesis-associated TTC17-interacting protein isoform X2 n=1 Tax=Oenanthe melanoleuca TaxID=2939378 RepID=UPI0024C15991|nr:ciliogenesis-associated TTC17-interacting protein isoform X2 [Oenanthe melanoleuca]
MEPARGGGLAVLPPGTGLLSSTPSLSRSPPVRTHTHWDGAIGSHCWRMGVRFPGDRSHNHPHAPNKRLDRFYTCWSLSLRGGAERGAAPLRGAARALPGGRGSVGGTGAGPAGRRPGGRHGRHCPPSGERPAGRGHATRCPEGPAAQPPPESPQGTPAMADTAAEFLSLIGLQELEWCLFAERLAVVAVGASPRDKEEGQWWMAAQWAPYQREDEPVQSCILVQTRFRGKKDGVPASSTLKAYVTWQLETLEQEEQESLELTPHPTEKMTHIVSHEHGMTVWKTLQEGESALGIQQQAVGSAETEVFVIQRAVHTSTGASTVWHSSFLPNGRLARLMQIGSPVLMLLQDESILSKSGKFKPQLLFPKDHLDWEEDIELFSFFLDRKDELQLSHAAYLQQHPEVRALLSDFLQALLLQQPHDPISFASEFFAHQLPIGTPFASTGAAIPLPNSSPGHPPANGK